MEENYLTVKYIAKKDAQEYADKFYEEIDKIYVFARNG